MRTSSMGVLGVGIRILAVILIAGGVLVFVTGADGDCADSDRTFCIAQHPSPTLAAATMAAGNIYTTAGLPFVIPLEMHPLAVLDDLSFSTGSQTIWPGTPDGKRALVSICLLSGSNGATISWAEGEAALDPGDSITVFSSFVQVGSAATRIAYGHDISEEYGFTAVQLEEYDITRTQDRFVVADVVYGTYTITLDLCE